MDAVRELMEVLCRALSRVGPYLAVEVLLPGGTLIALLLYFYRRRSSQCRNPARPFDYGVGAAVGNVQRNN
jgi:hypothetical protein